ncbi:MAG: copper resistance CopC family protein [Hyphomicrobiaceae bacterium]
MFGLFISTWLLAITLSPAVQAHTKLTQTVPKDGATAEAGLSTIEFKFAKPLWMIFVYLARQPNGPRRQLVTKGRPAYERSHHIKVAPLAAGSYVVDWAAVASDEHMMVGQFKFQVRE